MSLEELKKIVSGLGAANIGRLTVAGITYVKGDDGEWREMTAEGRAAYAVEQAEKAAQKAAQRTARAASGQAGGVSYNFGDIAGRDIVRVNIDLSGKKDGE